jgi:hypothetical protein
MIDKQVRGQVVPRGCGLPGDDVDKGTPLHSDVYPGVLSMHGSGAPMQTLRPCALCSVAKVNSQHIAL